MDASRRLVQEFADRSPASTRPSVITVAVRLEGTPTLASCTLSSTSEEIAKLSILHVERSATGHVFQHGALVHLSLSAGELREWPDAMAHCGTDGGTFLGTPVPVAEAGNDKASMALICAWSTLEVPPSSISIWREALIQLAESLRGLEKDLRAEFREVLEAFGLLPAKQEAPTSLEPGTCCEGGDEDPGFPCPLVGPGGSEGPQGSSSVAAKLGCSSREKLDDELEGRHEEEPSKQARIPPRPLPPSLELNGLAFKDANVERAFVRHSSEASITTDILVAIFFALLAFLSFSNNIRGIIGMWELAAGHWRHVHSTMHVCFLAIVLAGPTRGWYLKHREAIIAFRCLLMVFLMGTLHIVPTNRKYLEELAQDPRGLFAHWIVGFPLLAFISVAGLKIRFYRNLALQLVYLVAAAYALPTVCRQAGGYVGPFPCVPFIGTCQAALIIGLPCAICWSRERKDRLAFASRSARL